MESCGTESTPYKYELSLFRWLHLHGFPQMQGFFLLFIQQRIEYTYGNCVKYIERTFYESLLFVHNWLQIVIVLTLDWVYFNLRMNAFSQLGKQRKVGISIRDCIRNCTIISSTYLFHGKGLLIYWGKNFTKWLNTQFWRHLFRTE